jgi:hypothetical protein
VRGAIAWSVIGVVALSGCDQILGLQRNPPDAPGPGSCREPGPPGADDDGDTTINDQDACPYVPNQVDTEDEDQDLVPDACDLCPQKPGVAAGDDPDCDGLGAACDPQPMAANTRRFDGFGSQGGLRLYNTTLEAGAATMPLTNAAASATLYVDEPGRLPARLETEVEIQNARVYQYWSYELSLTGVGAPVDTAYEIQLEKRELTNNLYLTIELGPSTLAEASLGPLPGSLTNLQFRLEATITATRTVATIVVDDVGPATVEAPTTLPDPFDFGLAFNRDTYTTATKTTGVAPYLVYTTLAP